MERRNSPWAVWLAVFGVLSLGYAFGWFLVYVCSTSPGRDMAIVTGLWLLLVAFAFGCLRQSEPGVQADPTQRRWWVRCKRLLFFWRRRHGRAKVRWKPQRKPGQEANRPWGTPEETCFVPAPGSTRQPLSR
jgi:hypothetical protein